MAVIIAEPASMNALLPALDPGIAAAVRLAMALLFAVAAFHKLSDLSRFRATLTAYRIMPERLVAAATAGVIGFEVALAIGFLIPGLHTPVALGAASLLTIYTAAIATNLARGRRHIDCGCGGPNTRHPISSRLITRNALVIVAITVTATPPASRALTWLDGFAITATIVCGALLWTAANGLLALAGQRAAPDIDTGVQP